MPETVLVISNIAWDFVWQRHQTMTSLFAREAKVVFCEIPGVRRVSWADLPRMIRRLRTILNTPVQGAALPAGVRVLRPFVLPATNRLFCGFNAWQMKRLVARDRMLGAGVQLILDYSAARTALELIRQVRHERLVYDCTDDWLAVRGVPAFLKQDEQWLLQTADLTLVPSRSLWERKSIGARRCVTLPHGAMVERFLIAPKDRPPGGRLTLLYYGHLHRQHLDFALLDGIARARPDWRLILVGPVKTPHSFPPNVELPGQCAHDALCNWVAEADVLLLPYVINDYTRAVLPAKTYEYLATGRPIVATALPTLTDELGDHFQFPEGVAGWAKAIAEAVERDTEVIRQARVELAKANSWASRFRTLRELLNGLDRT